MTITDLINFVIPVLIAGLLILVGVGAAVVIVRVERNTVNPTIHTALEALRGFAALAIRAGETMALEQVTKGETALTNADKKAIADSFYALIPSTIYINGKGFPSTLIKSIVTQSEWESFIQKLADEGDIVLEANRQWLQKQLDSTAPVPVFDSVKNVYTANTTGATLQSAQTPQQTNITVNEGPVIETPAPTDPTPQASG